LAGRSKSQHTTKTSQRACLPERTADIKEAAKMKDRITKDKNGQLVTGGMFYCHDSAGFSVSASNKLLCILTGKCFEIGNKNIPPIRYRQV
jgi:hypothetical protein